MKKCYVIFLLLLGFLRAIGQTTGSTVKSEIDALLPTNSARLITAEKVRQSFEKVLNFNDRVYVRPEDFGAKGDGVTNDLAALQNLFNSRKSGKIILTEGKVYNIGTGTLIIKGSGNEANSLTIEGYGAKIISSNSVTTATVLFDDCMRTSVRGLEIDGTCDFDGWYFGNFEDCYVDRLRFGNQNLDNTDETYWSQWVRCKIGREIKKPDGQYPQGVYVGGIYIHTGTASDRTEFNANTFINCNIWYDTHAFHLYGNQLAQNCSFYSCDISYQTVARMEIQQEMLDSQFNFYSCYWDDDFSIPVNTKNVVINTYGYGNNPNSSNIGSHATLKTGSQNDVSSSFGGRTGSRIPSSSYNLIINGDLRGGKMNLTSDWDTSRVEPGTGLHGKYLHLQDNSSSIKTTEWTAIPAPFTGYYAVTVIGRNLGNTNIVFSNVIQGTDVYYNPVSVNDATDFVVSTGKVYLNQGEVYKLRVFTQANTNNRLDIAYVGLTYGRTGGLTATEHPSAAAVKTITSYKDISTQETIFTLPISANERISAKCTCYGRDATYPDGATFNEMVIVANHNGTLTYSLTSQTALKNGDISAVPTFAITQSGSNLLLNATPQDGAIQLTCELKGMFRQ